MPEKELRFVRSEVRMVDDGDGMHFNGYAARFNERTYIGPSKIGFYEQIAPGAFSRALKDNDVQMLFNHELNMILARMSSGTLRLSQDDNGLLADADLPNTSLGRDVSELVKRKDIPGMSFSFWVPDGGDRWETMPGGHAQLRTVLEAYPVQDVAPVTMPAYPTTTADVRMKVAGERAQTREARVKGEQRIGAINYGLVAMVQAADASIDAAAEAIAEGNAAQAACLLSGASLSIEEAMWGLWGIDPQLLSALGAAELPTLINAVDSAIDNAYVACSTGVTDPTIIETALSASDALLAALNVPDADDGTSAGGEDTERKQSLVVATEHANRFMELESLRLAG